MTSILDILAGGIKRPDDYLGSNPYYMMGSNIASNPLPRPTNNTEAILGPLLQGLVGGGLQGYGERKATEAAYKDISQSPLLAVLSTGRPEGAAPGPLTQQDAEQGSLQKALLEKAGIANVYGQANVPEGWSIEQGRNDQIRSLITQQSIAEQEAKKQAIRDEMLAKYGPEVLQYNKDLEAAKAEQQIKVEEAKAQNELAKERFKLEAEGEAANDLIPKTIPKSLRAQAVKELGPKAAKEEILAMADRMYDSADKIKQFEGTVPASSVANEFAINRAKLKLAVQKVIGTEPGPKVLAQLETATPDWNDSAEQKKEKRAMLKDLISSVNEPTPILDRYGSSPKPSPGAAPTKPSGSISRSAAQQEANQLKGQGKSAQEIAEILSAKYPGGISG